jgi:hypothetical protein
MWVIIGLFLLGLLVGNLVGLTATSVVTPLLGLLFAFVGGSVIVMLGKLPSADRRLAGQCIVALALGCLIGTYGGIVVTEYQLLSPKIDHVPATRMTVADRKAYLYLRSEVMAPAAAIQLQYAQGHITAEEAYGQLRALLQKAEGNEREP